MLQINVEHDRMFDLLMNAILDGIINDDLVEHDCVYLGYDWHVKEGCFRIPKIFKRKIIIINKNRN